MKKNLARKRSRMDLMTDRLMEKSTRDHSLISTFFPAGLMVLVALLLMLFGAITYASTDETLKTTERNRTYCTDYYTAEAVATEILVDFAENSKQMIIISDDRSIYQSVVGEIMVYQTGSGVSFTVPINKREDLVVMAKLTEGRIELVRWTIE